MSNADRRGFTLVETIIVIVVMAAITALAFPRVQNLWTRSSVSGARGAVANALQQARAAAITQGRGTTVHFDNATGRVWVTAVPRRGPPCGGCAEDTIGSVRPLTTQFGVALLAAGGNAAGEFTFDSRGLGNAGGNMTVQLRRAAVRDTLFIQGFGRVTK